MNQVASTLGMRMGYTVAPYDENNIVYPTDKQFIEIPQVTDMPALSQTRDTIETTPYSATKQKEYIFGLSDTGGALEFTVNGKPEVFALWNDDLPQSWLTKKFGADAKIEYSVMHKYKNLTGNDAIWIMVTIPELDIAWYQPIIPDNIGFPDTDVNAAFQPALPMTPAGQGAYNEIAEDMISYQEYIKTASSSL